MKLAEYLEDAPPELHKPMSRWWVLPLRLAVSAGIVAALLYHYDFSDIVAHLGAIDMVYAFAALTVIAAQYLLSSARWHYILRRHGIGAEAAYSFSIFGIGQLANLALITSLAGISVRGLLLAREKIGLNRIVGVLLVERIAAFGGMMLCVVLGLGISHQLLLEQVTAETGLGGGTSLLVSGMVIALLVSAVLLRLPPIRRLLAQIREAYVSIKIVLLLIVVSSAIIFLGFCGVAVLAMGVDIKIDPIFFVTAMPVVAIIASLPITVGGWGVREGMMVAGLGLFGVKAEPALALSVAYGLIGVLVSCIFGSIALVWYMAKWRDRRTPASGAAVD